MRGIAAMLGCAALQCACLGAGSHECSNATQTWLCPANFACADAPTYCGAPGLIQECADKPDLDPCAYSSTETGSCQGGVCTQCTPDLEGCPIAGWTPMTLDTTVDLFALWVAGRGNAFAGGTGGALFHYNGLVWAAMDFPHLATGIDITGLWGTSTTDVYAVAGEDIFHWDGTAWTVATTSSQVLHGIFGANGIVTAVGVSGTVTQLAGGTWTTTENVAAIGAKLDGVWRTTDDGFATEAGGVIRDHGGWTQSRPASGPPLHGIWGTSATDVYTVGDAGATTGTIVHFDGATWTLETFGQTTNLFGVWGSGPSDIYACGQSGTIAHRDGGVWTTMSTPNSTRDLRAIAGSSATDIFAVGRGGTIWRYDGD